MRARHDHVRTAATSITTPRWPSTSPSFRASAKSARTISRSSGLSRNWRPIRRTPPRRAAAVLGRVPLPDRTLGTPGRVLVKAAAGLQSRDEAIRLQGKFAETATIKNHEIAWLTRLYSRCRVEHHVAGKTDRMDDGREEPPSGPLEQLQHGSLSHHGRRPRVAERVGGRRLTWLPGFIGSFPRRSRNSQRRDPSPIAAMILQDEPLPPNFSLRWPRRVAQARRSHRSFKELVKTLDRRPGRERYTDLNTFPERDREVVVDGAKTASEHGVSGTPLLRRDRMETATEPERNARSMGRRRPPAPLRRRFP